MPPHAGEIVYTDSKDVLCRRWNWRECDKTKLTEKSRNVALVLEGIAPATTEDVKAAADELAELIVKYCGGRVEVFVLNQDRVETEF